MCIFVNANKNLAVSLATHWTFSLKFVSKEAQNLNILAAILSITQTLPGCIFVKYKRFNQMASDKPFNFHSGLWLLLSHMFLSQTSSRLQNVSIEDSEVKVLLTLWRMPRQLQVFFLWANGMIPHKHDLSALAAKTISNWWLKALLLKMNFFRIGGNFRGRDLVKWKSYVYLL